jgi:oxygen-independent coproporphyrinogen-3 oxidase
MAGFSNINVDLMSGIPGQSMDSWKNTLKKVTMLKPEHISAYSLIVEEGTPFWERYHEQPSRTAYPPLPDEETENKIYHFTRTFLESQGYERYEISNYAKPGYECRHNLGYWREASYLGLGLGSASYVGECRFGNERDLDTYLKLDFTAEEGVSALKALHGEVKELTRSERMEEFMFLGLRTIRGISQIDFVAAFGVKLETVYGPLIERLKNDGLMKQEGVWLSLTEWGMDVSNFVLSEFLLS